MAARTSALLRAVVSLQHVSWRYGDGLLPFLRKDPAWPHPDRAVNKGNDRHREELTEFILAELQDRADLIREMRADLSALRQAYPARQQLVQDTEKSRTSN